jgi:beta-mannosidase
VEDIGCNMVRCWGGNVYESDLFFDLCDRKGIMVWQDFSMACAIYPQEHDFQVTLAHEARAVVRRLRQHASIALWSGDNECDYSFLWGGSVADPNSNVLTRVVLPEIVRQEDPTRHYLPSSPYISPAAFKQGVHLLPEDHLWGPRDYYKGQFYTSSICHFASETGYHGCPSPASLRRFLSPDKVWPYQGNEEWILHSTSPVPGVNLFDYRVELMAAQVQTLFGAIPDDVDAFAFASQVSQAEAMKFFIERFRTGKWRRTGIIWWNILDGWPQLSDAVVDYYFGKKLAYHVIKASQQPLCLALREECDGARQLVACNDTQEEINLDWTVTDVDTGDIVAQGAAVADADAACVIGLVPALPGEQRLLSIAWAAETGDGHSHYLAGKPPFDLAWCRAALAKAGVLDGTVWEAS